MDHFKEQFVFCYFESPDRCCLPPPAFISNSFAIINEAAINCRLFYLFAVQLYHNEKINPYNSLLSGCIIFPIWKRNPRTCPSWKRLELEANSFSRALTVLPPFHRIAVCCETLFVGCCFEEICCGLQGLVGLC